ncbi:small integral membrane protein 3 isoform X1 [Manacus candei]|uniref:small integral membrane protein 3 isoform X1 n=2 Tax=Manacus candei TaxID=415023 RepID=UPI002227E2A0|nr:small integral membrane protein 3 isoform X1 [Manacus candei]
MFQWAVETLFPVSVNHPARIPGERLPRASGAGGVFLPRRDPQLPSLLAGAGARVGAGQRRRMDLLELTGPATLPKHILDVWVIVLIILATILVMTALVLCPATAVIIYRVRTHPTRNGIV